MSIIEVGSKKGVGSIRKMTRTILSFRSVGLFLYICNTRAINATPRNPRGAVDKPVMKSPSDWSRTFMYNSEGVVQFLEIFSQ